MSQQPANPGQEAESAALDYLTQQGLRFIDRNVRYRFGEIDLVMQDGASWVFVEVKYRSHCQFGGAIHALSHAQSQRIKRAASHFLQLNRIDAPCRFDVIAIDPQGINWIRDAF